VLVLHHLPESIASEMIGIYYIVVENNSSDIIELNMPLFEKGECEQLILIKMPSFQVQIEKLRFKSIW
jgi:hypothetical protein